MPRQNHTNNVSRLKPRSCEDCAVRHLCLPGLLDPADVPAFNKIVKRTDVLHRGDYLYRVDEPFTDLFAVFTGFFKAFVVDRHGREQVTAFHFPGEVMGVHALATRTYQYHTMSLNTGMACRIPFDEFRDLSHKFHKLDDRLHDILSRELIRARFSAANLTALQKVATLMMGISRRFEERGYASREFLLPMSNTDIASRLRLVPETVSRIFTRLAKMKILVVEDRHVTILDMDRLAVLCPHNIYLTDYHSVKKQA
ncbi:MAG TPA: helix-turn-helix domain-containing protein [Gammaproteobacteria bacterium]|nr:helix-turn-helix domain-containing protein [Gammaproteobacteria bacterium]